MEQGNLVVVQERVLAEIAHELGNFFHKLYYWSDYIKGDAEGAKKFDTTAGHMLERTITNLEDFLKVALEYFHPIKLNFTKVGVGELLDGFMTHLGAHLNGNEVRVWRDEIDEPATILVDPARISQAFRIALHHVHEDLKSGGALSVSLGTEHASRVSRSRDSPRGDAEGAAVAALPHAPRRASSGRSPRSSSRCTAVRSSRSSTRTGRRSC